MDLSGRLFLVFVSVAIVAVIGATGWKFVIARDYDVVVEAACDPTEQTCHYRECSEVSNVGDCPPNELEYYHVYVVKAHEFDTCADASCAAECEAGSITCTPIACGDYEDDECSAEDLMVEETVPVEEESADTPQESP